MRQSLRSLPVAAVVAASIASCTTTGNGPAVTIAEVQNAAVAACSFLPDAATITNILTASPVAATAENIAAIVCSAVTGRAAAAALPRPGAAPSVVVNGVTIPVAGHFVTAQVRRPK